MWSTRVVEVCRKREVSNGTMHHNVYDRSYNIGWIISDYTKELGVT